MEHWPYSSYIIIKIIITKVKRNNIKIKHFKSIPNIPIFRLKTVNEKITRVLDLRSSTR